MTRHLCQFSCGAASAVATKLVLSEGHDEVLIVNAFVAEELPDNRRFLADCERWLGRTITVLRDEKYDASALAVWAGRGFIKGPHGAPCSQVLKRSLLNALLLPDDVVVVGFTLEEQDRHDDLVERLAPRVVRSPLIEHALTKNDCLAMIQRAGIELPLMYRLGYENANCVGCPKGGSGYWNRIRRDFPAQFEAVAALQDKLGEGSHFLRGDRSIGERVGLRALDPGAGRHDEPAPSCSFFCEAAEAVYSFYNEIDPYACSLASQPHRRRPHRARRRRRAKHRRHRPRRARRLRPVPLLRRHRRLVPRPATRRMARRPTCLDRLLPLPALQRRRQRQRA
jgi:hypothetical protein